MTRVPTENTANQILVILGPTGTGKTRLALETLQEVPGEIISADSRQVYRDLDYSTNKIGPRQDLEKLNIKKHSGYWEQEGIRINLYDVARVTEQFSVSEFVKLATQRLEKIRQEQKLPVIVGGTGFYIDVLLGQAPFSEVKPNPKLRSRLARQPLQDLETKLQDLDEQAFQEMAPDEQQNPRRLIRYIELAQAAGSVQSAQQWSPLKKDIEDSVVQLKKIGLTADREILYKKADRWVDDLVESGHLVNETQHLISAGPEAKHLLDGMIFSPCAKFIQGELSQNQMIELIKGQLHNYIRSQLTWFKRDEGIEWRE